MKAWEKELYMYQLKPAPPKMKLQEYITKYCSEKDEKYINWFLHYYEPTLNTTVMDIVQRYAMPGHFADIKSVCVIGILRALESYNPQEDTEFAQYKTRIMWAEVHGYIRTMRTGYTVQSDAQYLLLRKAMALLEKYGGNADNETVQKIATELHREPATIMEVLQGGMRNRQQAEYYRQYEDDENGSEEIACDNSTEPYRMMIQLQTEEALINAFESLGYRERSIVAAHLGFCKDCWSTTYMDFDANGNPVQKKRKPMTFEEIAIEHMLSSPSSADRIYRGALEKMRKYFKDKENI